MVTLLARVANHIHSWFQSCPCHRGDALKVLRRTCPLAGCLLPWLAVGDLERFADELFAACYYDVLQCTRGLSPSDLMKVLADFENGRQHMMVHIRLKGAYHVDMPLLATALCHPDGSRVRAVAARAVRLWMSMTAEQRAAAHEKTRELMVGFLADVIAI